MAVRCFKMCPEIILYIFAMGSSGCKRMNCVLTSLPAALWHTALNAGAAALSLMLPMPCCCASLLQWGSWAGCCKSVGCPTWLSGLQRCWRNSYAGCVRGKKCFHSLVFQEIPFQGRCLQWQRSTSSSVSCDTYLCFGISFVGKKNKNKPLPNNWMVLWGTKIINTIFLVHTHLCICETSLCLKLVRNQLLNKI